MEHNSITFRPGSTVSLLVICGSEQSYCGGLLAISIIGASVVLLRCLVKYLTCRTLVICINYQVLMSHVVRGWWVRRYQGNTIIAKFVMESGDTRLAAEQQGRLSKTGTVALL